jgi:amino acid transporter
MAATPRVTFAMAERRDLPACLAAVHPRFATPAASILFFAAVVALLAISGSFVWLAVVSTLARMIVYAATIVALPRAPERPARLGPGHWLWGAAGLIVCGLAATQADQAAWVTLGGLAAVGLLLFLVTSRRSAEA